MASAGNPVQAVVEIRVANLSESTDRLLQFFEWRRKICPLFKPLRKTAVTELEKLLFKDAVQIDDLSESTNDECKRLYEGMEKDLQERREASQVLLQNVRQKVDELLSSENNALEYTISDLDYTEKLRALESQLDDMKIRKASAAARSIAQIRSELRELWRSSMVPEAEGLFPEFALEEANEHVYNVHLEHLQKWKNYYTKNMALFNEVKRRQDLIELKKTLEEKDKGIEKYKNRGGSLLKLQTELNRVTSALPRCEAKLLLLVQEFEKENRKKVVVDGQELVPLLKQRITPKSLCRSRSRNSMRSVQETTPLRPYGSSSNVSLVSSKRRSTSNPDLGGKRKKLTCGPKEN